MLNKILKGLIYATVFLTPIFYLPLTFEWLEFNKLYLLFFLVWLSVLVWLLKMIVSDKKVSIRYSIIDFAVLAFMAVAIISSVFSVERISSLLGYYGRFSTGLVGLLTFGAFYFLIVNNLGHGKEKIELMGAKKTEEGVVAVRGIIKALLYSGGVAMFFAYFALFGVWNRLAGINNQALLIIRNFALRVSPVGGTLEALAMFLVVLLILAVMMILKTSMLFNSNLVSKKRILRNILLGSFVFFAFILVLIADFTPALVILVFGLLAVVIFTIKQKTAGKEEHRLMLPISLAIISVLFLILNFRAVMVNFPGFVLNRAQGFVPERVMTQSESWGVAGRASVSGFKQALIGSGPGTFHYNFSKFRPESLTRGGLWVVAFERSGNVFSEILTTMGFLGLIGFLAIPGLFFWKIFVSSRGLGFNFKKKKSGKIDDEIYLLMIIFVSLLLIHFFYYQTLVLSFLFWLFLGLILGSLSLKRKEDDQFFIKKREILLKDRTEIVLVTQTTLIVLSLSFIIVCFFGFNFYLASIRHVEGLNEPNLDRKVELFQEAVNRNPHQARYQIVLSRVFLVKAQQELANLPEGGNQEGVIHNLMVARLFAENATVIAPAQFNSWHNLAELYQFMGVMSEEGEQFFDMAINFLRRASVIAPMNPEVRTIIGRLYLFLEKEDEARVEFKKAVEKVEDYAPAHISLALLLENEGKKGEAIDRLEKLLLRNPNNAVVLFHLGRLYYNDGKIDKAIAQFLSALNLNPEYSDARYSLAIAYERQGRTDEALEQLEIVLAVNPGNEEVKERIERLKAGTSEPEEKIEALTEEERILEKIE